MGKGDEVTSLKQNVKGLTFFHRVNSHDTIFSLVLTFCCGSTQSSAIDHTIKHLGKTFQNHISIFYKTISCVLSLYCKLCNWTFITTLHSLYYHKTAWQAFSNKWQKISLFLSILICGCLYNDTISWRHSTYDTFSMLCRTWVLVVKALWFRQMWHWVSTPPSFPFLSYFDTYCKANISLTSKLSVPSLPNRNVTISIKFIQSTLLIWAN